MFVIVFWRENELLCVLFPAFIHDSTLMNWWTEIASQQRSKSELSVGDVFPLIFPCLPFSDWMLTLSCMDLEPAKLFEYFSASSPQVYSNIHPIGLASTLADCCTVGTEGRRRPPTSSATAKGRRGELRRHPSHRENDPLGRTQRTPLVERAILNQLLLPTHTVRRSWLLRRTCSKPSAQSKFLPPTKYPVAQTTHCQQCWH